MSFRFLRGAVLGVFALTAAACSTDRLTVANYNSPTVEGIGKDPNAVQLLATGVLYNQRNQIAGYVRDVAIFGREGYNYFQTDGRNVSNYLVGIPGPQRLDPSGFASGNWFGRYQDMKNNLQLIAAVNAGAYTPAQKSAVAGFAKTWYAFDLLYVIMTRDSLGAPVTIPDVPANPAPFVSRDSVYKHIIGLLDEAKTNLAGGGAAFPFTLHAGFTGFNTPATFLQFNRAIRARASVLYGSLGCGNPCYQQAITAISESYATPLGTTPTLAQLDAGPLHIYSTTAGDVTNANSFSVNNFIFAHASAGVDAQKKANGLRDDRYLRKIDSLPAPVSPPGQQNIPAYHRFKLYESPSASAYILRNEELILLRAEANIALGNLPQALTDINTVRTVSGGLAPLAAFGANPLDALVYEKRYSTMFEGLRWADMRRWKRLGQLPIDRTGQFVAIVMPVPQQECDGRSTKPNGC